MQTGIGPGSAADCQHPPAPLQAMLEDTQGNFAAGSAGVFAASVQLDYLPARIRGPRSATEDDDC